MTKQIILEVLTNGDLVARVFESHSKPKSDRWTEGLSRSFRHDEIFKAVPKFIETMMEQVQLEHLPDPAPMDDEDLVF